MPALDSFLARLAAQRQADPLAPATVIVPSRLSALQLRRRLAREQGPFAGLRFEPMARIAELIAAAELARAGRRPLARPIADYLAARVALESRPPLDRVAGLQGYAIALRQTFRRLRRAGFVSAADIPTLANPGQLPEIARLYGRFRKETAGFYDEDDLLDVAAQRLRTDTGQVLPELGAVWVLSPVAVSASAAGFLEAVRSVVPAYEEVEIEVGSRPEVGEKPWAEPQGIRRRSRDSGASVGHSQEGDSRILERFILSPDAASEARSVVRGVIQALEAGAGLDEVCVFYSGDGAYRALLSNAFAAAGIPAATMPGTPLIELPTGRAVLGLARLPLNDYTRAELFDFLGLANSRNLVPSAAGPVPLRAGQWLRVAREAGVTHGSDRWQQNLDLLIGERRQSLKPESEVSESRRRLYEDDLTTAPQLRDFVSRLIQVMEPLKRRLPAREFVPAFRAIVDAYFEPSAEGLAEVLAEIDQLGTIDAVGGEFDLASFADALEANLRVAARRERSLGDGVLVTGYRAASGLGFKHVFVCGGYEGAFPAVAESEPLLQDEVWSALRATHPYVEDLGLRIERSRAEVTRLIAAADGGSLTWSSPLQAAGGTRELYPSPAMTEAARRYDATIASASDLRRARAAGRLQKPASPLAALLTGPTIDRWERRLRQSIRLRRDGLRIGPGHWLQPSVELLRARRGARFSEYDGNVGGLDGLGDDRASFSPTSLEHYAACGFRYFLASVLRLRAIDEPEEGATIGAAERGTLVHKALERFFREQCKDGQPRPEYRWASGDVHQLLAIFEEEFETLRQQGRAGLAVYADYDRRLLRADLATFLEKDSDFRAESGAIPSDFELHVGLAALGSINVAGFVDRLDYTADGQRAFVHDYKTGSARPYKTTEADPFLGGTKLQLPVYVLAASGVSEVEASYWFISRRGGFERIGYQDTLANRERFQNTVDAITDGVRSGVFPAVPGEEDEFYGSYENCRYCEFDRICSRRRVYEHQEKHEDAAMRPWSRIAAVARDEEDR